MRERIYLDTCVLVRGTDDQTQERVSRETAAIARILDKAADGAIEWIASTAVLVELMRNPHRQRRNDVLELLALATELVHPVPGTYVRAGELRGRGFGNFDALHLAVAEQAQASALLTVDDRFLRRAKTDETMQKIAVLNPVDWLRGREPWLIKR